MKIDTKLFIFTMTLGRITNAFIVPKSRLLSALYSTKYQCLKLEISTIEDMEDVGAVLSFGTLKGDVLLLDGDLGSGKTCFSRGFVRGKTGNDKLKVTSPTYLLSNAYTAECGLVIHHMDLYRLEPNRLHSLNLDFVFKECISLIEWPSRLGDMVPFERLEIDFRIDAERFQDEENTRYLTLKPHGERWVEHLKKLMDDGCLDDLIIECDEPAGEK